MNSIDVNIDSAMTIALIYVYIYIEEGGDGRAAPADPVEEELLHLSSNRSRQLDANPTHHLRSSSSSLVIHPVICDLIFERKREYDIPRGPKGGQLLRCRATAGQT